MFYNHIIQFGSTLSSVLMEIKAKKDLDIFYNNLYIIYYSNLFVEVTPRCENLSSINRFILILTLKEISKNIFF